MRQKKKKSYIDGIWIIKIITFAFFMSLFFSFTSEKVISNTNIILSIIVLLFFIFLGVIFDIIGVAIAVSDEKPFHAMATKKIKIAKMAIILKKNSDKVSSFCNDVIGDICGVISGSCGVVLATKLTNIMNINLVLTTLIITALISALTIGGKALGKGTAIKKAHNIHLKVSEILSIFYKK